MSSTDNLSKGKIIGVVLAVSLLGLLAVGGAAQTGLLDGVTDAVGIGDDSENIDGSVFDAVPERSNSVAMLDPVGLADDPVTENVGNYVLTEELDRTDETYNDLINEYYSEVDTSIEETLQEENINATLEVRDIGKVVVFSDVNSSRIEDLTGGSQLGSLSQTPATTNEDVTPEEFSDIYSGVIFELDANESEVENIYQRLQEEVDAEENTENVTLEQSNYKDRTIYTASNETISVSFATIDSDNGYHSVGRTEVVEDTIDTYIGNIESVDTDVGENTYLSVRASDIEEDLDASEFEQLNENATVTDVFISYSTDGQDTAILNAEISLQDIQNAIDYKGTLQNALSEQEDNNTLVESVNVDSEGTTITLEYNATTEEIETGINDTLESFGGLLTGAADSQADLESEPEIGQRPQTEVVFSQEVDSFENQTYNVTTTVARLDQADFVIVNTLGDAGNDFPDVTESESSVYGTYPSQSIVSYMSESPYEREDIPSDASETEVVDTPEEGAILISQGDEVVVTNINSSERVQVFASQNGRISLVDSYSVSDTLG